MNFKHVWYKNLKRKTNFVVEPFIHTGTEKQKHLNELTRKLNYRKCISQKRIVSDSVFMTMRTSPTAINDEHNLWKLHAQGFPSSGPILVSESLYFYTI